MSRLFVVVAGVLFLHGVLSQDDSPELVFLMGDWIPGRVLHLALHDVHMTSLPVANVSRPVAIDYDPVDNRVYRTDVQLKQILSNSLSGGSDIVVADLSLGTGVSVPDGLALDVSRRLLFYTDTGNDVIVSMGMNGSNPNTIINTGLDQPRAIVLDTDQRLLYFSDWGVSPAIAVASYDGSGRRDIVTTGIIWPNGLALDETAGVLYWCDAKTHKIESVRVDGTERRTVLHEPEAHYFDVFFYEDALYFTDWRRRAILNVPATGGHVGSISSSLIQQLAGLHVFSPNRNQSNCPDGRYGPDCVTCGQCQPDSVCQKTLGYCMGGCSPGYQGHTCTQGCSAGTYGAKCQLTCGNCAAGTCDHVTGRCSGGCQSGWTGDTCKSVSVCSHNFHTSDEGCVPCGQCAEGTVCDEGSGVCPRGCLDGWTGSTCKTLSKLQDDVTTVSAPEKDLPTGVLVGIIFGGIFGLVIIVSAAVIVVVIVLRRSKTQTRRPDENYCHVNNAYKTDNAYATINPDHVYAVPQELPPAYSTHTDMAPPPLPCPGTQYLHVNAEMISGSGDPYRSLSDRG